MEPTASEEFPILFGYVVGVSIIRLFYYFIYIIDYWINWFLIIKYAFGPPLIFNGFYTRLKWIGYRICNNALNSSARERTGRTLCGNFQSSHKPTSVTTIHFNSR